ncbi:MAG: hypothetical protein KC800_23045, partial [Candidatus Eremiobacteraeota bacterium]|nr:hypothetical protein [Candidatus Eremiobacteraeota bacterium]
MVYGVLKLSEKKTTQKITAATLLKKLKLEKKRSKLLKLKQLKTLKLLKAAKLKLLKYQKAYKKLKAEGQGSPLLEKRVKALESDLGKAQERLSKTLGLLKDSKSELSQTKSALREAEANAKAGHVDPAELEKAQARVSQLEKERAEQSKKLTALADSFTKLQDAHSQTKLEDHEGWAEA